MTGGGDVTEHFECTGGGVALDFGDCDEKNHDGVSGLVGAGSRSSADDALEVCAFKVPTSTIGGPDLHVESQSDVERGNSLSSPFLH